MMTLPVCFWTSHTSEDSLSVIQLNRDVYGDTGELSGKNIHLEVQNDWGWRTDPIAGLRGQAGWRQERQTLINILY